MTCTGTLSKDFSPGGWKSVECHIVTMKEGSKFSNRKVIAEKCQGADP